MPCFSSIIRDNNNIYRYYKSISPWKDVPLKIVNRSLVFKMQRILYQRLPRKFYIPIHRMMQYLYLRKMNKKVQK